jgi:hypothetical protein
LNISAAGKYAWAKPGEKERRSAAIKNGCATREARENRSAASKATWAKPGVRKRRIAGNKKAWAGPGVRKRRRALARLSADREIVLRRNASIREAYTDPEMRAKLIAGKKKAWAKPAVRRRYKAGMKKVWRKTGVRKRHGAAEKDAWAKPEVQERHRIGRLKGAAALLGVLPILAETGRTTEEDLRKAITHSQGGRPPEYAETILRWAKDLHEREKWSWTRILKKNDPAKFAAMTKKEREAAAARFRQAATYLDRAKGKREKTVFSPSRSGVAQ